MGREEETYEDTHLDTRLRARTLEDDIEPLRLPKRLQRPHRRLLRPHKRVHLPRSRPTIPRKTHRSVCEPSGFGKLESGVVDVDCADATGALGFCDGTCEDADGAYAEDEDGLAGRERGAAGGVEDDAEWFCECGCFETAPLWQPAYVVSTTLGL